jgi:hypothetical protein
VDGGIDLRIVDCDGLSSLEGLLLTGDFVHIEITDNDNLATLAPLRLPPDSQPGIVIGGNPQLADLDAFRQVTMATRVELQGLPLTTLQAFDQLELVDHLSIEANPALVEASLSRLRRAARLDIGANPLLVNAPALPALSELGLLWVRDNPELLAALSLVGLTSVEEVLVTDNARLQRFELGGVSHLRRLQLAGNQRLESVSFPDLVELGTFERAPVLGIEDHPLLAALEFPSLLLVDGALEIVDNPVLGADVIAPLVALEPTRVKVGLNLGDSADLAPCPFVNDGWCDEQPERPLCAAGTDSEDCRRFAR